MLTSPNTLLTSSDTAGETEEAFAEMKNRNGLLRGFKEWTARFELKESEEYRGEYNNLWDDDDGEENPEKNGIRLKACEDNIIAIASSLLCVFAEIPEPEYWNFGEVENSETTKLRVTYQKKRKKTQVRQFLWYILFYFFVWREKYLSTMDTGIWSDPDNKLGYFLW